MTQAGIEQCASAALLTTWLWGRLVGTDEYGNRYYQSKADKRRWVLYNGAVAKVAASRVNGQRGGRPRKVAGG